jgi:uncharacterized membrane protein
MMLMAAFVWIRPIVVGILGLFIIALQEFFGRLPDLFPSSMHESVGRIWNFIYPTDVETWPTTTILYVLVPWIGVMMAGYGFGKIIQMDARYRKKICLWIGLSAIGLFIIAGGILVSAEPSDDGTPFILRLLNQRKYPASPLFLLMTLGPVIALVPFAEKAKGWLADILENVGKVPMFYYLLHIPLIHITSIIVQMIRGVSGFHGWYASAPYVYIPPEQKWGLGLLYLVFILNVTMLYFLCRWYVNYKFSHPEIKWLKYF